jgi:hypothetical protein
LYRPSRRDADLALLIGIIALSIAIIDLGAFQKKVLIESGNSSIQILDQKFAGSTSITLSPTFPTTPTRVIVTPQTNSSIDPPFSYLARTTIQASFLAVEPAQIWTSATNGIEIYGNMANTLQPRVFVNPVTLLTWRWTVECNNPASVAGEYLKVEYSTDMGATFNDLSTLAVSHIIIDNVNCPAIQISNSGSFLALPSGFFTGAGGLSQPVQLAVFDVGGNGAGDNPSFININIEFTARATNYTVFATVTTTTLIINIIMASVLNNNVNIQVYWTVEQ